jgi:hypothetical protein
MNADRCVLSMGIVTLLLTTSGCAGLGTMGDTSAFAGAEVLSIGNVQTPLGQAGYGTMPSTSVVVGGAQEVSVSSVVLGISGAYFTSGSDSGPAQGPAVLQAGYHGWWGAAEIGAALMDDDGLLVDTGGTFALWPVATIGGYGFTLDVNQSESFDTALTTIPTGVSMTESGLLLGIALPAKFRLRLGRGGGVVLGLRPGFTYGAQIGGWSGASGGPSLGLLGGYLTASVGIGSW